MFKFLLKAAVNSAAIYIASELVEGFTFSGNLFILLGIGLTLALFHTFLYPIIKIVAFPLVLISFGLFGSIVNMALLWLLSQYVPGLTIEGILPLIWGTAVLSLANFLFSWL